MRSRYRLLLWLDALGLALVTVAGTAKGLDVKVGPLVAIAMGMISATVGGIIRDILSQEPSVLLKREIYVTATVVGAIVFVLAMGMGAGRIAASLSGGLVVFLVRGAAIAFRLSLPTYRSRPGRAPEEIETG
ncbi:MAG: trimeric intracellular cation channel family protein [Hyphomicrobiaceae bacterium]